MSSIGNRIFKKINRPEKRLVELFRDIPSSNINDEMNRLYCMHEYIRLINPNSAGQLLGTALTVKAPAGDNLMFHKALDMAEPGDVIVIDGDSGCNRSLAGEIMMRFAQKKGIAGIICDGSIRDSDGAQELTMPVYASGVTPQGPWKFGPGEINVPVACGGQVVFPGDILVGDRDGVVVVRPRDAELIGNLAITHKKEEAEIMKEIEEDTDAYAIGHMYSTEKRMTGKGITEIDSTFDDCYVL